MRHAEENTAPIVDHTNPYEKRSRRRVTPQLYSALNFDFNRRCQRGSANTYTGTVPTLRYYEDGESCSNFSYRDTAECNLARYLEVSPWVIKWQRRSSDFHWSAVSGGYSTKLPFEAFSPLGWYLFAIVDDDITANPLWYKYASEMKRGHEYLSTFIEANQTWVSSDLVRIELVSPHPWSTVMPKETADILLQYRTTHIPRTIAAIKGLFGETSWLSIKQIVDAVGHTYTYAQVMQMIWSTELIRQDWELPLGFGTRVGLVRQRRLWP